MHRREFPAALLAGMAAMPASIAAGPESSDPDASSALTVAERRAGVSPSHFEFPEGDIRRYGASAAALDNSAAIDAALAVSGADGAAAFIPPGHWKITRSLLAASACSMHGVGNASVILPRGCDGLTFGPSGNYPDMGYCRHFRDFQIVGENPSDPTHRGIVIDFASRSQDRVVGVTFENLYLANFEIGCYVRGLWFGSFVTCHFFRCYRGIQFVGESVSNAVLNCNMNRGGARGSGGAWGISLASVDGESTQSTRIISTHIYAYEILINVALALELQIEHCDLSAALSTAVQIVTTMGGCRLRDCWIQTGGPSQTTGVRVADIQPSTYASVQIVGNYLTCDVPVAGSTGIQVGAGNSGLMVHSNSIIGFDRAITLGASANLTCKHNRISCVTAAYGASSHALLLDSAALDAEIGPNEIIHGKPLPARTRGGSSEIVLGGPAPPPAGTPFEIDADAAGLRRGVTYYALDSHDGRLSLATLPGGPAVVATAESALQIVPVPAPLSFTAGTPAGLSFYGRGVFVMSLRGLDAPASGPVKWAASGRLITLDRGTGNSFIGSSNSDLMEATGVPSFLWPASIQTFAVTVRDAGVSTLGVGSVAPEGVISFHKAPDSPRFSSSGAKGIDGQTFLYTYG